MPRPVSLTHWGACTADLRDGDIHAVRPLEGGADPSPLLGKARKGMPGSLRIATRDVRRGWLRAGRFHHASEPGAPLPESP
ncbi:hypothetical protein [Mycobacterium sp. GA-1285]|uniref:hypothetical protein n=1 Tax=Mycobacterium sp. GA-1285 TaxID=1772282 RepID=UPI000ABB8AC4